VFKIAYSQSFYNSTLFGQYSFEKENELVRIMWVIDICKDDCFAMDTILFVQAPTKVKKDKYVALSDDIVEISPPEIYGKYRIVHDTIYLEWKDQSEKSIVLKIIDTLNVIMLYSDLEGPFINKIGHKKWAFYYNHNCGDVFSYMKNTKWYYDDNCYERKKERNSCWYIFDSLNDYYMMHKYASKIPDTGRISRYLH